MNDSLMIIEKNNIKDLYLEEHNSLCEMLGGLYPNRNPEDILDNISQYGCGIVALLKDKDNKKTLGCAIWKYVIRGYAGKVLHVDTLVTVEKGKGYGKSLVIYLKYRSEDLDGIQLECPLDNEEAQEFYEANGFEKRAYSYVIKG